MRKKLLILILPMVFACGCKTTKKTSDDGATNHNTELITDDFFRKPVKDKDLFAMTRDMVPLDTVYISKDTLNIYTKKVYGCNTDNFKLIWNGDFGQAHPPQTAVKLFQLVDGACKEKHRFHLVYNLAPLKLKGDTSSAKTTIIKVGGWQKMSIYQHN